MIFMGLTTLADIAARLIEAGRNPQTPAMAVRWATRPTQQTIVAPLAEIAARVAEAGMKPPATIVIGDVVGLRERLDWFEHLPLFGHRVVVTRAADQAGALSKLLTQAGAEAIELPVISLEPMEDATALLRLSFYDWLVFTSVNGVRYFVEHMEGSVSTSAAGRRVWRDRPATAGRSRGCM